MVVLGVGVPLVLYQLIRAETSDPTIVNRETAERVARQRGGRGDLGGAAADRGAADDRSEGASARRGERTERDGAGWGERDDGR